MRFYLVSKLRKRKFNLFRRQLTYDCKVISIPRDPRPARHIGRYVLISPKLLFFTIISIILYNQQIVSIAWNSKGYSHQQVAFVAALSCTPLSPQQVLAITWKLNKAIDASCLLRLEITLFQKHRAIHD